MKKQGKTQMNRLKTIIAAAVAALGTAAPAATIVYTVENKTATYANTPYGLDIIMGQPTSGYAIQYSTTSATGPWSDEPATFTHACSEQTVWFKITAPGYDEKIDSRTIKVKRKALDEIFVWVTEPTGGYVYDGTAKEPTPQCADPAALLTMDDFEVTYENNVKAGTATAVFTAKESGNYEGVVRYEFEIAKAANVWIVEPSLAGWTYGAAAQTPVSQAKNGTAIVTYSSGATDLGTERPTMPGAYTATFTVPESANYKALTGTVNFEITGADIDCVADDVSAIFDNTGHTIALTVTEPTSDYTVEYAEAEAGPWQTEKICQTKVGTKTVWYRISAPGYVTVTGSKKVTVSRKQLDEDMAWVTEPSDGFKYDGTAKVPDISYDDTVERITTDDFEVTYDDNVNAGTVTATFTATETGNYKGSFTNTFEIKPRVITLTSAGGSWPYDGTAHSAPTVTVGGDGFVAGEGATYADFATITDAGTVPNTFTVAFNTGTLATNYTVTQTYGTLEVTGAAISVYEETDAETIYKWEATGADTARIVGFKDANQRVASMVIPDKIEGHFITEIARGAFANSTCGATSLKLPQFCKTVGFRAFSAVRTLAEVTFVPVYETDCLTRTTLTIDAYAFTATALTTLDLSDGVGEVADFAFAGCANLKKVSVTSETAVGASAFYRSGLAEGARPSVVTLGAFSVSGAVATMTVTCVGGTIDGASGIRVLHCESLAAAPTVVAHEVVGTVMTESGCEVTIQVSVPTGATSGFFRAELAE